MGTIAKQDYPFALMKTLIVGVLFVSFSLAAAKTTGQTNTTAQSESGPLDIRAPDRLVLGRDTTATITLKKPVGEPPLLLVNTGSISPPKETPKGRLAVTYTLPKKQFPQVAIIAVVSQDQSLIDWIAIPLHGPAQIKTKTEPNATVEIRIGDLSFGPAKANKKGITSVDVEVPPGIAQGTTVATDKVGNRIKTPLALGAPPFSRILGYCPSLGDRMLLFVVDKEGRPDENAQLKLRASKGQLEQPTMIEPGLYQSVFTVSKDALVGENVSLDATIQSDENSTTSCSIDIQGGQLASLGLSLDPQVHEAGSDAGVMINVKFLDADGKPAQPAAIEFGADLGQVSKLRHIKEGIYRADWTLPNGFMGKQTARITAGAISVSTITTQADLALQPGPISRIEASTSDKSIHADGKSTTHIQLRAFDAFDNPVEKAGFTAKAEGTLSRFEKNENDSSFVATYTAPKRERQFRDTIVVRDKTTDVKAETTIILTSTRPPLALGPRVGYINNFGKISSVVFAADIAYCLPFLKRNLSVGLEAGFHFSNIEEKDAGDDEQVKTSTKVVPILARVAFQIPWKLFAFYSGVSGGVAITHIDEESESAGHQADRAAHGTIMGLMGADVTLGPGRVIIEAAYMHTFEKDSKMEGNRGGLLITAGYRFEFLL